MGALIKLSQQLLIDKDVKNKILKELWEVTFDDLASYLPVIGADNFEKINNQASLVTKINNDLTEFGDAFLKRLKNRLPDINQFSVESNISFTHCRAVLLMADLNNKDSYQFYYYLISELLTCVSDYGDNLLLATGDKSTELKSNQELSTFLLRLGSGINIIQYKSL